MFSFRPEVPETRQDTLLEQVRTWNGVVSADRLFAAGPTPEIRRMCYVYVVDWADASVLVNNLEGMPEIANAFVPPAREPM